MLDCCGTARPRLWRDQYYNPGGVKINPHLKWGVLTFLVQETSGKA